jgi:hypothetical protein
MLWLWWAGNAKCTNRTWFAFLPPPSLIFPQCFPLPFPPLAGFYNVSLLDPEFNQMAEEWVQALVEAMDFEDKPAPLLKLPLPQPQKFSPTQVFNEAPFSPLTPTRVTPVQGATPTLDPSYVPIRSKLAKKQSLPGSAELSVFDILNTFQCHWFVSVDHLRAAVLSAQKAKDGKKFWVKFTPQFHTHLVKCAVVLVPHPLQKVKQMMFMYLLELLNGEGPQSFFNLSKGQRIATQA